MESLAHIYSIIFTGSIHLSFRYRRRALLGKTNARGRVQIKVAVTYMGSLR